MKYQIKKRNEISHGVYHKLNPTDEEYFMSLYTDNGNMAEETWYSVCMNLDRQGYPLIDAGDREVFLTDKDGNLLPQETVSLYSIFFGEQFTVEEDGKKYTLLNLPTKCRSKDLVFALREDTDGFVEEFPRDTRVYRVN